MPVSPAEVRGAGGGPPGMHPQYGGARGIRHPPGAITSGN